MLKEQKIFIGTVVELVDVLIAGTTTVQKRDRNPIVFMKPISAVNLDVAKAKLVKMAEAAKEGLDLDNLEITCDPFHG